MAAQSVNLNWVAMFATVTLWVIGYHLLSTKYISHEMIGMCLMLIGSVILADAVSDTLDLGKEIDRERMGW